MQRHAAGILALLLLVGSGILLVVQPTWDESQAFASSMLRIGAVIGAIWLAYPELKRLPRWLIPLLVASAAAIAFRPRMAFFLVPIVLAIMILRPKNKKQPPVAQPRSSKRK